MNPAPIAGFGAISFTGSIHWIHYFYPQPSIHTQRADRDFPCFNASSMSHPQSLEAFATVQTPAQQTRDRIMAVAVAQGCHGLIADELTAAWQCSTNV